MFEYEERGSFEKIEEKEVPSLLDSLSLRMENLIKII